MPILWQNRNINAFTGEKLSTYDANKVSISITKTNDRTSNIGSMKKPQEIILDEHLFSHHYSIDIMNYSCLISMNFGFIRKSFSIGSWELTYKRRFRQEAQILV